MGSSCFFSKWFREALTAAKSFLGGLEGPVEQDDASAARLELILEVIEVRRIVEMDHLGRVLWSGALVLEQTSPPLLLSELATLPFEGSYLALLRSWSSSKGNDIRLYLLDLEGADDVTNCSAICRACQCDLNDLAVIREDLLLQWTLTKPLKGLTVDNYEAMTVVPPSSLGLLGVQLNHIFLARYHSHEELGGVALLLVNDNNDNPSTWARVHASISF